MARPAGFELLYGTHKRSKVSVNLQQEATNHLCTTQ